MSESQAHGLLFRVSEEMWIGESSSGGARGSLERLSLEGILVSLFAGAYLCNELPFPVQVQLGDEDWTPCRLDCAQMSFASSGNERQRRF